MSISIFKHCKIFAILAAFSLPLLISSGAEAKTCKSYYNSGIGKWSVTKTGARFSARAKWRKKIKNNHGFKWASWTLARGRHYDWCDRNDRGRWKCKALARACRPGN